MSSFYKRDKGKGKSEKKKDENISSCSCCCVWSMLLNKTEKEAFGIKRGSSCLGVFFLSLLNLDLARQWVSHSETLSYRASCYGALACDAWCGRERMG